MAGPDAKRLAIESPVLLDLYAYWDGKRAGRPMPARADLDPLEFRAALGHVFLVDVEPGPRFRYRLTGTIMTERTGYDLVGRYVDDIPVASTRDFIHGHYRQVLATRAPVHAVSMRDLEKRPLRFELLSMPLSTDGAVIDMLFVGFVFLDADA